MSQCKVVDERFLETAKARGVAELEMAVSAQQVFAALEDGPSWSKWVPVIRTVRWTSPPPYQVGTTRTVGLLGGIRLDEVFWAWRPLERIGFYVASTNNPTMTALAECYDVTPLGSARCKLRWRMAMEMRGPLRLIEPYMRTSLGPAMLKMLKQLERVASTFPRADATRAA